MRHYQTYVDKVEAHFNALHAKVGSWFKVAQLIGLPNNSVYQSIYNRSVAIPSSPIGTYLLTKKVVSVTLMLDASLERRNLTVSKRQKFNNQQTLSGALLRNRGGEVALTASNQLKELRVVGAANLRDALKQLQFARALQAAADTFETEISKPVGV
jgi:hypothetical protein